MAAFLEDIRERLKNTAESLSARRRKIFLLCLAFLAGLFCLSATWISLNSFKRLDTESAYLLGNFPDLAKDPKWRQVQRTRRILFPFVMLSGVLGAFLVVGSPIVYWHYRDD
ncbi:MAG: hypothetical protein A3J74_04375 [Elusimicrobia bacterium RIFCSPHIGHO2_02_FULL_57_9]|nr:MAG: hypothetical protein A3J74_04375 [Elusimicrobia bacterium RIFCSPHIGHO2_02_FULL_57_9]